MGDRDRDRVELPPRVILYTLDQIAMMVQLSVSSLRTNYLHYEGRTPGARQHKKMHAVNLANDGEKPDWRVSENELVRWLRYKGFKIYSRTTMIR